MALAGRTCVGTGFGCGPTACAGGVPVVTGEATWSWTSCWIPGGGVGRERWSFGELDPRGGDRSKVTLVFLIASLSMDEFVGDAIVGEPDAAPRSLLEVVGAAFVFVGASGVPDELLTVSA